MHTLNAPADFVDGSSMQISFTGISAGSVINPVWVSYKSDGTVGSTLTVTSVINLSDIFSWNGMTATVNSIAVAFTGKLLAYTKGNITFSNTNNIFPEIEYLYSTDSTYCVLEQNIANLQIQVNSISNKIGTIVPATTGTMSVVMDGTLKVITPTGACSFNATSGTIGQNCTFVIITSGVTSYILTWGTNFKTTATLATGTVTAKVFSVGFVCVDGTLWVETGRTTAM